MKVLHIISGLKVGGAEMALYRLIKQRSYAQHTHIVAALDPIGEMSARFMTIGITVKIFDIKRSPISDFLQLTQWISHIKPDIVQTWLYHSDLIGGLAARLAGVRYLIWGIRSTQIPSTSSLSTKVIRRLNALLSWFLPTSIVCVAEAARNRHIEIGYNPNIMRVIPNGIDVPDWVVSLADKLKLRSTLGFDPGATVIGTLGRFSPDKGQRNFIHAAKFLLSVDPSLCFLIVGRGCTDCNRDLVKWVEDTGYARSFKMLDEQSDVKLFLSAMDIFVLPSQSEGFPNVLAEAMAVGIPCVSTDVGDAAFLLDSPEYVVPPENPPALAAAVAQILNMPVDLRLLFASSCRDRIINEFSMEKTVRLFSNLYEELNIGPQKFSSD